MKPNPTAAVGRHAPKRTISTILLALVLFGSFGAIGLDRATATSRATEKFCASAPHVDRVKLHRALGELLRGHQVGNVGDTFRAGEHAYVAPDEVSDDVRLAAAKLQSTHAAALQAVSTGTPRRAVVTSIEQRIISGEQRLHRACQEAQR